MVDAVRYDIGKGVTAFSLMRDAELPFKVVQAHQVHSDRVAVVTSPDTTREELEGFDALVTNVPGVALGARTADCVPVLLYDSVHRAAAAVHSGWKGTVLQIARKTLGVMASEYGTSPADVVAVIGPSIGPDSFQVGQEVADAFAEAGFPMMEILSNRGAKVPGSMAGGLHIDLWRANIWILESAGVPHGNIIVSGIDSFTSDDFYSARREGAACGRTINIIKIEL